MDEAAGGVTSLRGCYYESDLDDGTISSQYGIYGYALQQAGTNTGDMYGGQMYVDQNGGTLSGDAFGLKISVDLDGTVGGTAYTLYLDEGAGLNYGIYQDGSADNYFGGRLDSNADSVRVRTSQSPASGGDGEAGEIAWDGSYLYVCTATDTWARVGIAGGY